MSRLLVRVKHDNITGLSKTMSGIIDKLYIDESISRYLAWFIVKNNRGPIWGNDLCELTTTLGLDGDCRSLMNLTAEEERLRFEYFHNRFMPSGYMISQYIFDDMDMSSPGFMFHHLCSAIIGFLDDYSVSTPNCSDHVFYISNDRPYMMSTSYTALGVAVDIFNDLGFYLLLNPQNQAESDSAHVFLHGTEIGLKWLQLREQLKLDEDGHYINPELH